MLHELGLAGSLDTSTQLDQEFYAQVKGASESTDSCQLKQDIPNKRCRDTPASAAVSSDVNTTATVDAAQRGNTVHEALQLEVDGKVLAVAVRQTAFGSSGRQDSSGEARVQHIKVYRKSGTLLATEKGGMLWGGKAEGSPTHSVLRATTPLVRHITLVGQQSGLLAHRGIRVRLCKEHLHYHIRATHWMNYRQA